MEVLHEIFHHKVNLTGKILYRDAVRGVILQDGSLLMIYSPQNGDYKFPGGGVDVGESLEEALIREIREECGTTVAYIEREFGCVIEYDRPAEPEYDVFKMTSHYYVCHIESADFGEQELDDYEQDLGFQPVWVDINEAIMTNTAVLNSVGRRLPRWTKRETFMLEQIKQQYFLKNTIS